MPLEPGGQDELLEGIYQDIEPILTERLERPFLPWHKPRKHYIRIQQWCAEVRRLIELIGYHDGDVIRYLGFPGEDFLDVRTLQGVCQPKKIWLKYLGFDSTATYGGNEFNFNLARHEVFDLGFIDEHSEVLKTRIEQLANDKSLAYKKTAKYHDFDIINIDLCNSLVVSTGEPYPPYFEAIKKLCDMQIMGRTRPWLLFLATRAIREQFDAKTKRKLFDCVTRNINESQEFAAKMKDAFGLDDDVIHGEVTEKALLSHDTLVKLFGVSIGKWLLQIMERAVPKAKVSLRKSYCYRVQVDEPDMLSLAFLFEPMTAVPADISGLTKARHKETAATQEWRMAIDLIAAVSDIEDIDQKLLDDPKLHAKLIEKCGDLLQTAHYDKEKYRKWAEKASWSPE